MDSIATFMQSQHRQCDEHLAHAEQAIERGQPDAALQSFVRFAEELTAHLEHEERVLFPAFEEATGMCGGPTEVMRAEHEQIRCLLPVLESALRSGDVSTFRGLSESLLLLVQQHNMKEEQILYPGMDQMLDEASREALVIRLLLG